MQIVGGKLFQISKPIFWEKIKKKKKINLSSAKLVHREMMVKSFLTSGYIWLVII